MGAQPHTAPKPAFLAKGCTRKSQRCVVSRSYRHILPECCRGHLRQLMADLSEAFTHEGATWWADYGTLLGAVRNPLTTWADYPWLDQTPNGPLPAGIVPHDKDADLGALGAEWSRLMAVRSAMLRKGYHVDVSPQGQKMKFRLSAQNHTNIDLFAWRERPNGTWFRPNYIYVDNYKGRDIPPGHLFPLGLVSWEGMVLPAPAEPERFLAFRYGPNWRKPVAANHDGVRR